METLEGQAIMHSGMQPRADIDDLERMMDEMGIKRRVVRHAGVSREGPEDVVEERNQSAFGSSGCVRRRRRWDDADAKRENHVLIRSEESGMDQVMGLLREVIFNQSRIRKEIAGIKQAIEGSEDSARNVPVASSSTTVRRCFVCESENHMARECDVPVRRVLESHDKTLLVPPRRRGKRAQKKPRRKEPATARLSRVTEIVQAAARHEARKARNKKELDPERM